MRAYGAQEYAQSAVVGRVVAVLKVPIEPDLPVFGVAVLFNHTCCGRLTAFHTPNLTPRKSSTFVHDDIAKNMATVISYLLKDRRWTRT